MLGIARIQEITNSILSRSSADQTEVVVEAVDQYLTRFANSTIHQNVAETDTEVRIRLALGTRVGVASTNSLDEAALAQTLDHALSIARLQPENPDFKSLPGPQPVSQVEAFSEATADCSPEFRANAVGAICLLARQADLSASGALTTAVFELGVANSLGVFAHFPTTYADINTVVMSDTSAGYAAALALNVTEMDFEAIGQEAVKKCVNSRNPQDLEPGDYTVILEPYAVQDIVQMMTYTGFGAVALQEGRSFMNGKLGELIVDPRVSIRDDGSNPAGIPLPFDFEGVPRQRVDLIKNGVAQGVVWDSYRAGKEEGQVSTGHALPAGATIGPLPLHTFMEPGEGTIEEMIASTKQGIYITRFHYTRPVEPTKVVITGMTRDGTFLIEDGRISHPVKNLRFTTSYLDALNHVAAIGGEARLLTGLGGIGRDSVPALKLSKFTFTGATEF